MISPMEILSITPNQARTAAARAARLRASLERDAERLREHGWVVTAPEDVVEYDASTLDPVSDLEFWARANGAI